MPINTSMQISHNLQSPSREKEPPNGAPTNSELKDRSPDEVAFRQEVTRQKADKQDKQLDNIGRYYRDLSRIKTLFEAENIEFGTQIQAAKQILEKLRNRTGAPKEWQKADNGKNRERVPLNTQIEQAMTIIAQQKEQEELSEDEFTLLLAQSAIEKMWRGNLRLAFHIAKSFRVRGLKLGFEFGDIIELANIGLLNAVERFDPLRERRFSTCAGWWIKEAIRDALKYGNPPVKIPKWEMERSKVISDILGTLEHELKRTPTPEDILATPSIKEKVLMLLPETEQTDEHLLETIGDFNQIKNLTSQRNLNETDNTWKFADKGVKTAPISEGSLGPSLRDAINELLEQLPVRDRIVIEERFGWDGDEPKTLIMIGQKFRLSKERVRQIENKVLLKLREIGHEKLNGFLE